MSTTVDQRVVELQFNNKDFESNAKQSLRTLEDLNTQLKNTESGKALKDLDKSVKNVDMDSLAKAIDTVNNRFSTMGIIGMTALQNITNGVFRLGKNLYDNTIGQIKSGGFNRALNLENAKFQLQGLLGSAEKVAAVMEDVDYGVKDTAYSLDAAAKVASSMAASGIQAGDAMKTALRGISGVAAMTNSSYEEIGHIFTTVAGQSKLMTMQLRQLEMRGMNAAATMATYFNNIKDGIIIDSAVEDQVMALTKGMTVTEADIRDFVTDGVINFEIFSNAMDDTFGEHAKQANNTFTGALANMKSALSRTGAMFAESYLTNMRFLFNDLRLSINAMNNALKPFAKEFDKAFTTARKAIDSFFTESVWNKDKKMFTTVLRTDIIDSINNMVGAFRLFAYSIKNLLAPIGEAFAEVFGGPSQKGLERMTHSLANFAGVIFNVTKSFSPFIKSVSTLFFTVIKKVSTIVGALAKNILPIFVTVLSALLIVIGNVVSAIAKFIEKTNILQTIVKGITTAIVMFIAAIALAINKLIEFVRTHGIIEKAMSGFSKIISVIGESLGKVGSAIGRVVKSISQNGLAGTLDKIANKFRELKSQAEGNIILQGVFETLARTFEFLRNKVIQLTNVFKKGISSIRSFGAELAAAFQEKGIVGIIEILISKVASLFNAIRTFVNGKLSIFDAFKGDEGILSKTRSALASLIETVKVFSKEITLGKIVALGFSLGVIKMMLALTGIVESGTGLIDTIKDLVGGFKDMFNIFNKEESPLMTFSKAFAMIAASLVALAIVDANYHDNLMNVTKIMGGIVAAMLGFVAIMSVINKIKGLGPTLQEVSKSFMFLGVGIAAASAAIMMLGTLGSPTDAATKIGALIVVVGLMAGLAVVLSKFAPSFISSALSLLVISFGITLAINAVKKLEDIEPAGLVDTLKDVIGVITVIAAISKIIGTIKLGAAIRDFGIGILALVGSFLLLEYLAERIRAANFSPGDIAKAVGFVVGCGALIAAITFVLSKISGQFTKIGASLLMFVGAMALLELLAERIKAANFTPEEIDKARDFLMGIGLMIAGIIAVTAIPGAGSAAIKLGAMILMITVALYLLVGLSGIIGKMNQEGLSAGVNFIWSLGIMIGALIAVSKLSEKANTKAIMAIILGITVLAMELIILSVIPFSDVLGAAVSLGLVMGALALVIHNMKSLKDFDTKSLVAFGMAIAAFAVVGSSLIKLSGIPWQDTLGAAASMGIVMLSLAVVMRAINNIKVDTGAIVGLIAAITSLAVVGLILENLAQTDWAALIGAAAAVAIVMASLSFTLMAMNGLDVNLKTIGALGAAVLALAGVAVSMGILAESIKQWEGVNWGVLAVAGAALLGITVSLGVLGYIGPMVLAAAAALLVASISFSVFAAGCAILAPAAAALSSVDLIGLAGGLALMGMAASLAGTGGMALGLGAAGYILAGVGMTILAPALAQLAGVDVVSIGLGLAVVGAAGVAMATGGAGYAVAAVGLLATAAAIAVMAASNPQMLANGLIIFGSACAGLSANAVGLVTTAANILAITVSFVALAAALPAATLAIVASVTTLGVALKLAAKIAGVDFGAGLLEGVNAAAPAIAKGFANAGELCLDGFGSTTGWKSPWTTSEQAGIDFGAGLLNGLKSIAKMLFSAFGDVGTGCATSLAENLDIGNIDIAESMGLDNLTGKLESIKQDLGVSMPVMGDYKDLLSDTTEQMSMLDFKKLNSAGDSVGSVNNLTGSLQDLNGELGQTNDRIADLKLEDLAGKIGQTGDIYSQIQRQAVPAGQALITQAEQHIEQIEIWSDNLEKVLTDTDVTGPLRDQLAAAGPEMRGYVAAVAKMTDEQQQKLSELAQKAQVLPQQVATEIGTNYIHAGTDGANKYVEGFESGFGQAKLDGITKPKGVEAATGVKDGFVECLSGSGADEFSSATETAAQAAVDSMDTTLGTSGGAPSTVTQEDGNQTVAGFVTGVDEKIPDAENEARMLAERFLEAFKEAMGEHMYDFGRKAVEDFIRGLESMRDSLRGTISQIVENDIKSEFKKAEKGMYDIGVNIMQALIRGIQSQIATLTQIISGVTKGIKDTTENRLEIMSPSRVFQEIGAYIMEGWAKGIVDNSSLVENALVSSINDSTITMQNALAKLGSMVSDNFDINPVITPMLDTTYLTAGVNTINRLFDDRVFGVNGELLDEDGRLSKGTSFNFTQNNYSPKALSSIEIYRQTKNQFAMMKGLVARG